MRSPVSKRHHGQAVWTRDYASHESRAWVLVDDDLRRGRFRSSCNKSSRDSPVQTILQLNLHSIIASTIRGSIVVSISACHADDPGSIPGRGIFLFRSLKGDNEWSTSTGASGRGAQISERYVYAGRQSDYVYGSCNQHVGKDEMRSKKFCGTI